MARYTSAMNAQGFSGTRRPPTLNIPFSDGDMQAVIAGARRVLDEIGIGCASPEVRGVLASLPGVRASGERVYLGDKIVDAILADSKAATPAAQDDPVTPFKINAPWCCLQIADVRAGQVRPATSQESARAVRLLEGAGATVQVAPVACGDVPPELRNLAGLRTVLKHSRSGCTLTNPPLEAEIGAAVDMGAAAGREARAFIMAMLSPLRFDTLGIEYFIRHRQQAGLRLSLSGNMPCTGATAPLHLPGTLIQSLAESLGMAACARALGEKGTVGHVRCDPCDMRSGNYVIGSPEYHLLDMAARALYRTLTGNTMRGGAFRSMAKFPDAQAMAERSFSVLFQALQGARAFGAAGQLAMDELFSPEQVILDCEILRNVERIVQGMEWSAAADGSAAVDEAVALIRAGTQAGHYLEGEETLSKYREFFYSSNLFGYGKLEAWVQHGAKQILAQAGERVAQIVDSMPEYAIAGDRVREVDLVFEKAARQA
ncbi:MAG: trimethylamine methyltransferase family protein [Planctomycetota bacterium]